MRRKKLRHPWGGIFNKERFRLMEEENEAWLRNLSIEDSTRMTEEFLSSSLFSELTDSFIYNEPLCVKLGLKVRKNARTRI